MAKTYRDVAIDQMIATVEEAMSRAIDWWGNLPTPMNEAIDSFAFNLGSNRFRRIVKKALDRTEYRKRQRRRPLETAMRIGCRTAWAGERSSADTAVGKAVSRRQT